MLVLAQMGLVGSAMHTPIDVSYLADNILVLRYFEAHGAGSAGDLDDEEAQRRTRALDPRTALGPDTIHVGGPLIRLPRNLSGSPTSLVHQ